MPHLNTYVDISESVHSGESIYFEKISRYDMASYLCIASNGVPPSLMRKMFVSVECTNFITRSLVYKLLLRFGRQII